MPALTFFLLGHRGMLGHVVHRHLVDHGHRVVVSDHRYVGDPADPLIAAMAASKADVVVNCAGITTHRGVADGSMFVANTLLPMHVAAFLAPGQLLVHPSTDCVFDGHVGDYAVDDTPNSTDPYGLSKRLGELALTAREGAVVVLRTSIVGPEQGTSRGLLAWFLAQSGPVNGWVDHRWNGITTLAWAQLCLAIARGESPLGPGLHQPTTEAVVTKLEMLERFADVFDHRIEIVPVETGAPIDRTLHPSHVMPPLEDQLRDLRAWMPQLA